MKIKRLLAEQETPDFSAVLIIISAIIIYGVISSLALNSLFGTAPDGILLLAGILNTLFITFLLIIFIFIRFKSYLSPFFKTPQKYFVKGLYFYLAFIPLLIMTTVFTYNFLIRAGINPQLQQIVLVTLESNSTGLIFLVFFSSCIIAPLTEEIIYRGVIYKALKKSFSSGFAIILSSIIFALLHGEISSLPALFFMGIILASLFEKYGNLWVPIGMHFFNNFFANLALFIVKFTGAVNLEKLNL